MSTRFTSVITNRRLIALFALCGLALPAAAQNALDNNLQVGSGGRNPSGRDFAAEFRFRNAIVTGNAPNGMSFRGNVGYRAPGEFTALLGSDSTFLFRRDSVNSGLGGLGIRGTDALQYQMALTTGNSPPPGVVGVPIYGRTGIGATAGSLGRAGAPLRAEAIAGQDHLGDLTPTRPIPTTDTRGLSLQAVRSPSSYMANRGLEPLVVGLSSESGKYKTVTSSVLRGISYDDLSGYDRAKEEKPEEKPVTTASTGLQTTSLNTPATPEKPEDKAPPAGVVPIRTAYDEMVDRMKKMTPGADNAPTTTADLLKHGAVPSKAEKPPVPEWQRRMDELRAELADQQKKATEKARAAAAAAAAKGDKPEGDAKPGDKGNAPAENPDGTPSEDKAADPKNNRDGQFDVATLGMLRDASGDIKVLAPPSFDPYGVQMQAAQQQLAAGRFFDAEERFTAALSARSGDPMAAIGRVHAEIGAGMFLSAAINLRTLLVEHPEVSAVKYGPELLPTQERAARTFDRLTELSAEGQGRGRDPALLLAYLGYQVGNTKAMNLGLERMVTGAPADGPDQLSRLARLLREVWTKPATTTPAAAPAEAPQPVSPTPQK